MSPKDVTKRLEDFEQQVCQQLRELQERLASVVSERPETKNNSDVIFKMQEDISAFAVNFQKELVSVRNELHAVSESISRQDEHIDQLEQYSRRNCLIFHGVAEKPDENVTDIVLDIMKHKLNVNIEISAIDRAHRIGHPSRTAAQAVKEGRRPIIVKFVSYLFRSMVFRAKRALKNTSTVITESLTNERQRVLKCAKEKFGPRNCWTQDGRIVVLHVNRKIYVATQRELQQIQ